MDNSTLTALTIICIVTIFFLLFINLEFTHTIYWLKREYKDLRKELIAIKQKYL